MRRNPRVITVCVVFAVCVATVRLHGQDAEGCKDSPLITRFPGAVIHSCENKEFDQADFPLNADGKVKHLEGRIQSLDYGTREGLSELQVYRNMETASRKAGFIIDYAGSPYDLVAHKDRTWVHIESKGTYYYQTIVTETGMPQEVTADASSLAAEIQKTGHVAIYGIRFDTGKADILPASGATLDQVVTLLQQDASLRLRVEGHTDDQGTPAANQTLSEKRAQAVVAWLVSHAINASRLTAKGFGQTKPIADNGSEDGRAKNRRVELARM